MAKFRIKIKKSAAKEIANLPQNYLRKVLNKIDELVINPHPSGTIKLSGEEKYRIKIGIYRLLYQIFEDRLVMKVAHIKMFRKEIIN